MAIAEPASNSDDISRARRVDRPDRELGRNNARSPLAGGDYGLFNSHRRIERDGSVNRAHGNPTNRVTAAAVTSLCRKFANCGNQCIESVERRRPNLGGSVGGHSIADELADSIEPTTRFAIVQFN